MSRAQNLKSRQQFESALALEKSGDTQAALKLYEKSVVTDPSNSHAWNRQMILYRRLRSKAEEFKLIKTAIKEYQSSAQSKQQEWLNENKEKAESTRELANALGLLESTGLPKKEDAMLEKWQTRLYLLEYRIKNARRKKTSGKKKAAGNSEHSGTKN
jgi:tetratricopeptide (TPR) repeat protein